MLAPEPFNTLKALVKELSVITFENWTVIVIPVRANPVAPLVGEQDSIDGGVESILKVSVDEKDPQLLALSLALTFQLCDPFDKLETGS